MSKIGNFIIDQIENQNPEVIRRREVDMYMKENGLSYCGGYPDEDFWDKDGE